jgi:hypothetical protein
MQFLASADFTGLQIDDSNDSKVQRPVLPFQVTRMLGSLPGGTVR